MKKRTTILAGLLCLATGLAHATVVNFTAGEGYTDGWITTNVNWNGVTTNHVVSTGGVGYNGTNGVVTLADGAWVDAVFSENLKFDAAGDTVIAKYRFQYTSTNSISAQRGILSTAFVGVETNGMARCGLRRIPGGKLRFWIAGASGSAGGDTTEALAGVTAPSDASDWLELTIKLIKNSAVGTSDFTFIAALTNLTTSTGLIYSENPGFSPRDNLHLSAHVNARLSSGWEPSKTATTNRIVDRFEVQTATAPVTTIILGGSLGNADFEHEEPAAVGGLVFTNVANWVLMGGPDATTSCSFDTSMNWSGGDRGGYPFNNRHFANDTGFTCTSEGQVFNLTYGFGRVGGTWNGDETNRTYLFTTSVPVDENIVTADRTAVLGTVDWAVPTTAGVYGYTVTTNGFYTTKASDVGKTFYFATVLLDAGSPKATSARMDDFVLSVLTPPPTVTLWDAYATEYGLTNGPSGDQDLDGENNWYEYVLGGDPTNGAVRGIQPSVNSAGGYLFSIRGDDSLSYSVITNINLIIGSWGTNGPIPVTETDGAIHAMTNFVGTVNPQLFMKLLVE